MNKRIVAIIGTPKKTQSDTLHVIKKIFDSLDGEGLDYKKKIITLSNLKIFQCTGCTNCFLTSKSCTVYDDDVKKIEQEIEKAYLVIFASPVYLHNVTGIMKNFIDRISYGAHIFRFGGKYGVTISTSFSNGNKFVNDYLKKTLTFLGIKVISQLSIKKVHWQSKTDDQIKSLVETIKNLFIHDVVRPANDYENKIFQEIKSAMLKIKKITETSETLFWDNNGYFKKKNFDDLF